MTFSLCVEFLESQENGPFRGGAGAGEGVADAVGAAAGLELPFGGESVAEGDHGMEKEFAMLLNDIFLDGCLWCFSIAGGGESAQGYVSSSHFVRIEVCITAQYLSAPQPLHRRDSQRRERCSKVGLTQGRTSDRRHRLHPFSQSH